MLIVHPVSQFTLLASTKKGSKPSFSGALGGDEAQRLYNYFVAKVREGYEADRVKDGVFRAMMEVALVNDGPVRAALSLRWVRLSTANDAGHAGGCDTAQGSPQDGRGILTRKRSTWGTGCIGSRNRHGRKEAASPRNTLRASQAAQFRNSYAYAHTFGHCWRCLLLVRREGARCVCACPACDQRAKKAAKPSKAGAPHSQPHLRP